MTYNTGIELFDYEVTISDRGGLGVRRVTVSNLPSKGHPEFDQWLLDALINAGISVAQHHIVSSSRK